MSIVPPLKRCAKCDEHKPRLEFNKSRGDPEGLQRYCRACQKEKADAYVRLRRSQNSGRVAELAGLTDQQMRERALELKKQDYQAHQEERKAQARDYYHQNRAHGRAMRGTHYKRNRQQYHKWAREWAKRNPLRTREYCMRHYARKRKTMIGPVSYEAIWQRDRGICHICGLFVDFHNKHFDHIIPLSKGGPHIELNIAVSHPWCNQEKGDRPLDRYTNHR